ncbi:MAG: hypothetical protein EHM12_08940 [Dehalococcoidia bacterium]|nr:MAG: hypothetical protein EHM12_08940 [Dehalococcoidia bacterium]
MGQNMMINENCSNMVHQDLISFLKENEFTGLRLRLILFWGRHPQTKFNLDCIAHFLDVTTHHVRELMKELIDKGMVNEQYCTSGIAHYSLNYEHCLSAYIQHLAELDWSAIKNLELEIEQESVPA